MPVYRLLPDLVVATHFAFVAFAALGGFLALRWRRLVWAHLPALGWAAFVELTGRICPLTPLENRLRAGAGLTPYRGDFIEHYLLPVLYPSNLTHQLQLALATLLIVGNAAVYSAFLRRRAAAGFFAGAAVGVLPGVQLLIVSAAGGSRAGAIGVGLTACGLAIALTIIGLRARRAWAAGLAAGVVGGAIVFGGGWQLPAALIHLPWVGAPVVAGVALAALAAPMRTRFP
jgi:hypothetical protein